MESSINFSKGWRALLIRFSFVSVLLLVFLAPDMFPMCPDSIWIQKSPTADHLYQVFEDGKIEYIDDTGNIAVRTEESRSWRINEYGGEFHDGLLLISNYPHAEFMDRRGKTVRFENVDQALPFSDGVAPALDKATQKWGFINTKGEFVIPPAYQRWYVPFLDSFSDGMALINMHDRYGFLDRTGAFAIDATFLAAGPFHDGMARVIIEGPCRTHTQGCDSFVGEFVLPGNSGKPQDKPRCKYAFIDKAGHTISDQRFDDAKKFSEGLAPVQIDGKWGFIDKRGAVAIQPKFDNAEPFSDGVALVTQNGLFGFIGHDGTLAIQPQFKYAEGFVDGLAVVGNGPPFETSSTFWYVDHSGHRGIQESFLLASSFFKGLAHVKLSPDGTYPQIVSTGQFAYIDRTGKRVFTY